MSKPPELPNCFQITRTHFHYPQPSAFLFHFVRLYLKFWPHRNRTCCDTCGRTDFSQLQLWWQTLQFQSCLAKRTQCQHYVHTNQTSTNFGKIRPPPGYCKQILDFAHCYWSVLRTDKDTKMLKMLLLEPSSCDSNIGG